MADRYNSETLRAHINGNLAAYSKDATSYRRHGLTLWRVLRRYNQPVLVDADGQFGYRGCSLGGEPDVANGEKR